MSYVDSAIDEDLHEDDASEMERMQSEKDSADGQSQKYRDLELLVNRQSLLTNDSQALKKIGS